MLLLIGCELVLSFQFQFELDLLQLPLQPLVFIEELVDSFTVRSDYPVKILQEVVVLIRRTNDRSQGGAAKMRAVANVFAAVLMVGIKAKIHRHPFLNAENVPQLTKSR